MKPTNRIPSLSLLLLSFLIAGCIHEYPNENPVDPTRVSTTLHITPAKAMIPFPPSKSPAIGSHTKRFILEMYNNRSFDKSLVSRQVIYRPVTDTGSFSLPFSLHATKYRIAIWQDYVESDTSADRYYTTTDLASISIIQPHVGCNDYKDVNSSIYELDLSGYRNHWHIATEKNISLDRPLAKIRLVTTDIDKYLDKNRHTKAREDLASFRTTISYTGYFPTGFNVFDDKPNDSRTGVFFDAPFCLLSENKALIGYDYVFVNGKESAVTAAITIYDAAGNEINRIGDITFPIQRNKITTIEGEFLTRDYTPGIGIDPGFEGDINISIPD